MKLVPLYDSDKYLLICLAVEERLYAKGESHKKYESLLETI